MKADGDQQDHQTGQRRDPPRLLYVKLTFPDQIAQRGRRRHDAKAKETQARFDQNGIGRRNTCRNRALVPVNWEECDADISQNCDACTGSRGIDCKRASSALKTSDLCNLMKPGMSAIAIAMTTGTSPVPMIKRTTRSPAKSDGKANKDNDDNHDGFVDEAAEETPPNPKNQKSTGQRATAPYPRDKRQRRSNADAPHLQRGIIYPFQRSAENVAAASGRWAERMFKRGGLHHGHKGLSAMVPEAAVMAHRQPANPVAPRMPKAARVLEFAQKAIAASWGPPPPIFFGIIPHPVRSASFASPRPQTERAKRRYDRQNCSCCWSLQAI